MAVLYLCIVSATTVKCLSKCASIVSLQTDLYGIKWLKFTSDNTSCVDPLDDPVLLSFTRCIQSDILCVWRKVQKSSDQRAPDLLLCNKELWIFWYGKDEPPNLRDLLSSDLRRKYLDAHQ